MTISPPPKISVVIFIYNFGKYVRESIESVLAQTLRPFEIIICDDHSIDESWAIISEYSKQYPELIKPYRHEKNMGPACNGNFGLKRAKGDLVTWLDGDDRWLPQKLELEWKVLQRHPDAQIAYSNVYIIDAEGNRTGIWYDGKDSSLPRGDAFVEVYSKRFFPNNHSVFRNHLMHRSALDEVGYIDENLDSYWDWDLKILLAARCNVIYSEEALVEYRIHQGGFSRREPVKHFRAMVQVYEKHLPLLDQRSRNEATRVKCHIESLLALRQINLPLPVRLNSYSPRSVYDRNRRLLDQLPEHDRAVLQKEISASFKSLAWQAARQEIERGNRRLALKYWLEFLRYNPEDFGLRLVAQIVLPRWAYSRLKAAYHDFRDIRR